VRLGIVGVSADCSLDGFLMINSEERLGRAHPLQLWLAVLRSSV